MIPLHSPSTALCTAPARPTEPMLTEGVARDSVGNQVLIRERLYVIACSRTLSPSPMLYSSPLSLSIPLLHLHCLRASTSPGSEHLLPSGQIITSSSRGIALRTYYCIDLVRLHQPRPVELCGYSN